MMFILWSPRNQGWLTAAYTYVSDRREAKVYSYEEAIFACKKQYRNGLSEFGLFPISLALLSDIME